MERKGLPARDAAGRFVARDEGGPTRPARERLELSGGRRPQLRKPRTTGWTAPKRREFLAALSGTCNIAAALRQVGMCRSGLDKLRQRDAAFRAAMREAIRSAYQPLELFVLERLMNGTVKTVTRADGSVETVHEFPLHLAIQLLRLHKDTADAGEAVHAPADLEAVRARLLRKLDGVRRRLEREEGERPEEDGE
jgi:hypothetical protein